MEAIKCGTDAFHGGIESERHRGGFQVVVDGLWNSDYGKTGLMKLEGGIQGTIATDDDQPKQVEVLESFPGFPDDFSGNEIGIAWTSPRDELATIDGAEDRAAGVHDSRGFFAAKWTGWDSRDQALEAVAEAQKFPAPLFRATACGGDDGVQSGAVAPTCQDANAGGGHRFRGRQRVPPDGLRQPNYCKVPNRGGQGSSRRETCRLSGEELH